jgi:hypothetical protein
VFAVPSHATLHAVYKSFEENNVQYGDLEALGCLPYPVSNLIQRSPHSIPHLIIKNENLVHGSLSNLRNAK